MSILGDSHHVPARRSAPDHPQNDSGAQVVPIGAEVVIGAALRSARRQIQEAERRALLVCLQDLADEGCAAASLVRAWLLTRGDFRSSA